MADRAPARREVERFVKESVAALAGVRPATLNETTELKSVLPNRAVADRFLALSLRGAVAYRGGRPLTEAEVRKARTIRDLIEEIIRKWK